VVHDPEKIGGPSTPEPAPAEAALVTLRLVDEQVLSGAELPTAKQLALSVAEFQKPPAPEKPERAPEPLPAVPPIAFTPQEKEMVAAPISDQEWAELQADLEPDPVVVWQAIYASAGPVPAAQSWL
jgi:hypothetical protein